MAHSSQDIAIVVSEMVTNALRHALPGPGDTGPRRPVRLGLLQQGPWVLCAVADPGKTAPVPRTPGSLAEAGRGLQMICAFSDLWGYTTPGDAGKVVWAMFTARHAPPSPARYPGSARPRPGAGNSTLTTGTKTARRGPRAQSRPGGRDSAMLSPARIRCHRRKGIGRPGRRSARPDPARTGSRLVRPVREYEPGRGQGHAPVPAVHSPALAPLTGLVVRAPGRRPVVTPGLREGMFLPAEVTRGAVITGEFRA